MRLIQFKADSGTCRVGALAAGSTSYRAVKAHSVRELALDAHRAGQTLEAHVASHLTDEAVNIMELAKDDRLLLPLDHPEPSRVTIAITGLTHLGSAQQRDAMHAKLASDTLSDSMKMFKLGVEGGKPEAGQRGVQPEWAYKGDGDWMVPPGAPIEQPHYAEDGGEEAEVAGLYVIADDGTVLRVGYALGNEYSDHVMERQNYLYLAHSKLRQCSFGPELLVGELPQDVQGTVSILREGNPVWSSPFLSGEANMSHSIRNLELHHFKYAGFRRPGDVHIYFYGAGILSFGEVTLRAGDMCKVECEVFGMPLCNPIVTGESRTDDSRTLSRLMFTSKGNLTVNQHAEALARFADAILPGDDLFPAASVVGAQGTMAIRLRERLGDVAVEMLASAFATRGGLDDPTEAAIRVEGDEPALFDAARVVLTYAYYEAPAVIAAIRQLGYVYNDTPQPHGYAMRPFDPAIDAPHVQRGYFVQTKDITRVDLSGLDFLEEGH